MRIDAAMGLRMVAVVMASSDIETNPFEQFAQVFARASAAQPKDPNAMVLATVSAEGRPSSRVVLMKGFDQRGFVFYTNTRSRKGQQLAAHAAAALCFYWPSIDIQVRIEGDVHPVTAAEADAYFASRARGSQLGAWASEQSAVLNSREVLEARLAALETEYEGKAVPRPEHWSGYRVAPLLIEFWEARPNRLHVRTVFRRDSTSASSQGWRRELLNP